MLVKYLYTPFPRPRLTLKNIIWVYAIGAIASLFIIFYKPFNINNSTSVWYFNWIILLMGLLFSSSIFFIEFVFPKWFKSFFKKWNLAKAILWYAWIILFVSAVMFLFKSFLAGFSDFTLKEYIFVIGRISGISLVVSFFGLGVFNYFKKENISQFISNEKYKLTSPNADSININLNEILYIKSDDNYVDIHKLSKNSREIIVFRSSLKNIENQIVNPLSPIYRCHRQYLININFFKVKNKKSRGTSVCLKNFEDEIPVSAKYSKLILEMVNTRH